MDKSQLTYWIRRSTRAIALVLSMLPAFGANENNYTYLALGDSIAFGFNPTLLPPFSTKLPSPDDFVGYPERFAAAQHLLKSKKIQNAACPGESSGSFLTAGAPDLGCNSLGPQGQPPFKPSLGLKVDYPGPQMDFALNQLLANKHISLVTLSIGGNDLSMLQAQCAGPNFTTCVATGLPAVLANYGQNLSAILRRIRNDGKYTGTIVLVTYYSPSADPLFIAAVAALNQVMVGVGTQFGARIADGFGPFQIWSALSGGDPCAAGLLIRLPDNSCDIHPSEKGRDLLTATVLLVAKRR